MTVQDLSADGRCPCVQRGRRRPETCALCSASPLPLHNQDAVGVVAVLSEERHPWSAEVRTHAARIHPPGCPADCQHVQRTPATAAESELATQLQGAVLNSRAVIEQAKQVLIGQQGRALPTRSTRNCGHRPGRSAQAGRSLGRTGTQARRATSDRRNLPGFRKTQSVVTTPPTQSCGCPPRRCLSSCPRTRGACLASADSSSAETQSGHC